MRQSTRPILIENFREELMDYFIRVERQYDGIPIYKDNVESLFDSWVDTLTLENLQEIILDYV